MQFHHWSYMNAVFTAIANDSVQGLIDVQMIDLQLL